MKFYFILILLLLFKISSSQLYKPNKIGIIKDKDGYTFIRKGKSINSEIIDTIFESEFFQFEPSDSSWIKVIKGWDVKGYMHKSRIQDILDLNSKEQKSILRCILTNGKIKDGNFDFVFNNYKEGTSYYESIVYPAGNLLISSLKYNFDEELFKLYLYYMIRNSGSADEAPFTILGYIFIDNPYKVLEILKQEKYKNVCCFELGFGFENASWKREKEIENYEELKKLVDEF